MVNAVAYCSLLAVAICAYAGLPWYTLLVGTVILALITIIEQQQYRPKLAAIGKTDVLHTAALASVGNALLASGAAHFAGVLLKGIASTV